MQKRELEERIVEARAKLKVSDTDFSWLSSKEFTDFLDAWLELYAYYQRHDGETTSIHCEVVNVYLDLVRGFNRILRDPKHSEHHEQVQEVLGSLEYLMDGLVGEGYRQLNNP